MKFAESAPFGMRASMAHDLERGNRLELDWLAGKVVELGRKFGVPVPANEAVYALLKPYRLGDRARINLSPPHFSPLVRAGLARRTRPKIQGLRPRFAERSAGGQHKKPETHRRRHRDRGRCSLSERWSRSNCSGRAASRKSRTLAEKPPLPEATRQSVFVAPIAIPISAIRQAMEQAAPRNLTGKPESQLNKLLAKAEIEYTLERSPLTLIGRADGLTIATNLQRLVSSDRPACLPDQQCRRRRCRPAERAKQGKDQRRARRPSEGQGQGKDRQPRQGHDRRARSISAPTSRAMSIWSRARPSPPAGGSSPISPPRSRLPRPISRSPASS